MEGKEEKEEKEEKKSNFWKHRVKLVLKKNFRGHNMNRKFRRIGTASTSVASTGQFLSHYS